MITALMQMWDRSVFIKISTILGYSLGLKVDPPLAMNLADLLPYPMTAAGKLLEPQVIQMGL